MENMTKIVLVISIIAILLSSVALGLFYTYMEGMSSDLQRLREDLDTVIDVLAPEGIQRLVDAKAEGKVVWYTVFRSDDAAKLMNAFKAKYPWIEVEWLVGGSYATAEKYLAEVAAGNVQCDLIQVDAVDVFIDLKANGYLMNYTSPEYEHFPVGYKDPGYWAACRLMTGALFYNTEEITEPPTSYYDLLKPEYAGKVLAGDFRVMGDWYTNIYVLWDMYGSSYFEQLKDQISAYYTSNTIICDGVTSGEGWISIVADYRVPLWRDDQGAPIDGVWPEEGVIPFVSPMGIVSQAPHPNAAKLFLDFVLSAEGQSIIAEECGLRSVRTGAPSPVGMPPTSELNLITVDWDDLVEKREDLSADVAEILGIS